MASSDLVSVIIPTYNRADRCRRAVESACEQSHEALEIIVVDDGSQDETADTLQGLDDRVRYVRQRNAGVAAARNHGLKLASGDYVAFLDSDDTWLPRKLEAQLAVLRAFPEAGMVWTDMAAVDEADRTIHDSYLQRMYSAYTYFDPERDFAASRPLAALWDDCPHDLSSRRCYSGDIARWMFMGNLVHTSTALLRRDRRDQVGEFDASLRFAGEDYDFHYRTCRRGPVAYMDVPTVRYRVGAPDQLTRPELMPWIARNDLRTIAGALEETGGTITLPRTLVYERLGSSFAWLGHDRAAGRPAAGAPRPRHRPVAAAAVLHSDAPQDPRVPRPHPAAVTRRRRPEGRAGRPELEVRVERVGKLRLLLGHQPAAAQLEPRELQRAGVVGQRFDAV